MSAIPRKQRVSLKEKVVVVRKRIVESLRFNRIWSKYLLFLSMVGVLVGVVWILNLSPQKIEVQNEQRSCIRNTQLEEELKESRWWSLISGRASELVREDYPCILELKIRWQPLNDVFVKVQTKEAALAVLVQSVEVRDDTNWVQVFQKPREGNLIWYVSEDGVISEYAEQNTLPRVTFLRDTETRELSSREATLLLQMVKEFQAMENAYPKIEYYSGGRVRVSSVAFPALYLTLDENWLIQMQKVFAVVDYLKIRGEKVEAIDAHDRDIIVMPR